jgi:hypothetical protein
MKNRAMAKKVKPNRILIRLPTIGYTEFNQPLSTWSRCLLMKDSTPRETKPAPKTNSPALVDSFSKCLGFFTFGSGHTLIGIGNCYPVRPWSGSLTCRAGCTPIFWVAARRHAAGRLGNEPEQAGYVAIESGLMLLVPRQKASSVQVLAANLCYGVAAMDGNVSLDCLCSCRN